VELQALQDTLGGIIAGGKITTLPRTRAHWSIGGLERKEKKNSKVERKEKVKRRESHKGNKKLRSAAGRTDKKMNPQPYRD
jgi:hypothetical protein